MVVENKHAYSREKRIEQLKAVCDSIKENAADFIGNEEFRQDMKISIVFNMRECPVLLLERSSIPSEVIKRDLL